MIRLLRPGAVRRAHPRESGQTMLLVAMLSTVTLGLTAVAFRTTDDAIVTEDFQEERDFRDVVISGALGRGVELLRTGDPPKNPYRYVETYVLDDGSKFYTQVEFHALGGTGLPAGSDRYEVIAMPGTQADLIKYGPPPEAFGPGDEGDGGDGGGDDHEGDSGEGGDDGNCGDRDDGKDKGRGGNCGIGWGVGGIPPGSDEGGKQGWTGDKPPGDPGPDKNDGKGSGKEKGRGGCDD
jgi:two-component system chemotaxis sensor kinase CheA